MLVTKMTIIFIYNIFIVKRVSRISNLKLVEKVNEIEKAPQITRLAKRIQVHIMSTMSDNMN